MKKILTGVVLALLAFLLSSCPNAQDPGQVPPDTGTGSLTINLPALSLQPEKNPDLNAVSSYDLWGAGPGGASFQELGITATAVTMGSLVPGDWGVTINGSNIRGLQIASTTVSVSVVEGKAVSADVAVTPSSGGYGSGTFDLSMSWPVSLGIVSVSLTPPGAAPISVVLPTATTENGFSTVHATTAVAAGWYTVSRQFQDGASGSRSGGANAIRILPDATTTLVLMVDGTGVHVTMTPDVSNTIPITLSDLPSTISRGEKKPVTATPTFQQKATPRYQWYLDGQVQPEASSTFMVTGDTVGKGMHRLCVVVSANGVLGSSFVDFSVSN